MASPYCGLDKPDDTQRIYRRTSKITPMIEYIRLKQKEWFKKIQPYLLKTNLNVGSGLGFFSEHAKRANVNITSLEVSVHPGTVNQEELVLYDGKTIPFPDEA